MTYVMFLRLCFLRVQEYLRSGWAWLFHRVFGDEVSQDEKNKNDALQDKVSIQEKNKSVSGGHFSSEE